MADTTVVKIKQKENSGMGVEHDYMLSDGSRVQAFFHENGRLAQAKFYDENDVAQGENLCFSEDGSQVGSYFIENGKVMTSTTYKNNEPVNRTVVNYGVGLSKEYAVEKKAVKPRVKEFSMN